jgi:hypothetical protein
MRDHDFFSVVETLEMPVLFEVSLVKAYQRHHGLLP